MTDRILKMNFAGRFIDLLGQQMYGGAVPSVAELIANAWDADAPGVEVSIPENLTAPGAEIVVKDRGDGMSFDEINKYYLWIGYERRQRGERTAKGRKVMGRKGIGKLAGFGIAENIIIHSVKEKHVVQFNLNYAELKSKESLQGFEFLPTLDEDCTEPNGVTVTYKNLKARKNIDVEAFRKSMGRRFALGTGQMEITINGVPLTPEDFIFEHRDPAEGWEEAELQDFGKIAYWFGFSKTPIQDSELRGISVFARDRVAQFTPFFFNLAGGINGQVGLEYLTGQVKSDELDDEIDHIATDRQTINWQFGIAPILEKWGQGKIKELCRDWKKRTEERKRDKFKHDYSELYPLINPLPDQERKDVLDALDRIAGLERIGEEEFTVIARSMVSGVQRESVRKVIRRINSASIDALDDLYEAIKEWDVISAVAMAEVVRGKIEIIRQFERNLAERLPEKKVGGLDMQTFIKGHPWLLGQEYEYLQAADFHHEHGVDKWIEEVLKETNEEFKDKDDRELRRFDLVCMVHDQRLVVLELMRPGQKADFDHLNRLLRYVTKIQVATREASTKTTFQNKSVYGILIADGMATDGSLMMILQNNRNLVDATTWGALFHDVEGRYKDFLDILKLKAPDDPRIKGLVNFDGEHS
jgi:Histidine kinase-, DNA gyrase B-, and HSP90-like ATPase